MLLWNMRTETLMNLLLIMWGFWFESNIFLPPFAEELKNYQRRTKTETSQVKRWVLLEGKMQGFWVTVFGNFDMSDLPLPLISSGITIPTQEKLEKAQPGGIPAFVRNLFLPYEATRLNLLLANPYFLHCKCNLLQEDVLRCGRTGFYAILAMAGY